VALKSRFKGKSGWRGKQSRVNGGHFTSRHRNARAAVVEAVSGGRVSAAEPHPEMKLHFPIALQLQRLEKWRNAAAMTLAGAV
jgi:hypothetical protein